MNNDPYYEAALQHVNRVRALRDLDPIDVLPAGKTRSFAGCPIARAVGGIVGTTDTCVAPNGEASIVIAHEPDVQKFIERFDAGFYPELDGRLPNDPQRRSEDAWRWERFPLPEGARTTRILVKARRASEDTPPTAPQPKC